MLAEQVFARRAEICGALVERDRGVVIAVGLIALRDDANYALVSPLQTIAGLVGVRVFDVPQEGAAVEIQRRSQLRQRL